MKKTLLATAIAGAAAFTAEGAQAATVYNQDGTKLDLYGNIQIAYYSVDGGAETTDEIADNGTVHQYIQSHTKVPGTEAVSLETVTIRYVTNFRIG